MVVHVRVEYGPPMMTNISQSVQEFFGRHKSASIRTEHNSLEVSIRCVKRFKNLPYSTEFGLKLGNVLLREPTKLLQVYFEMTVPCHTKYFRWNCSINWSHVVQCTITFTLYNTVSIRSNYWKPALRVLNIIVKWKREKDRFKSVPPFLYF
jgi:hypothetical protein